MFTIITGNARTGKTTEAIKILNSRLEEGVDKKMLVTNTKEIGIREYPMMDFEEIIEISEIDTKLVDFLKSDGRKIVIVECNHIFNELFKDLFMNRRHYNADVICVVQSIKDISPELRDIAEIIEM